MGLLYVLMAIVNRVLGCLGALLPPGELECGEIGVIFRGREKVTKPAVVIEMDCDFQNN